MGSDCEASAPAPPPPGGSGAAVALPRRVYEVTANSWRYKAVADAKHVGKVNRIKTNLKATCGWRKKCSCYLTAPQDSFGEAVADLENWLDSFRVPDNGHSRLARQLKVDEYHMRVRS